MIPSSLYIHIPFCRKRCLYCAFFSSLYDENIASSYINGILTDLSTVPAPCRTIYIGGGTPSILSKYNLTRLLDAIRLIAAPNAEWTIEANPESLTKDKLKIMLGHGVNRLSLGAQSLFDVKLTSLGRIHSAASIVKAVSAAKSTGFKNISMDFIFGLWNETLSEWRRELNELTQLNVQHISAYSLSYEKGASLRKALRRGKIKPLKEEVQAEFYELAMDTLLLKGFKQYEISNFAKPGYECRHNITYWNNEPYYGFGASAVSCIDGTRSRRISDIKKYVDRTLSGVSTISSSEKLTDIKHAKETAAFKIRMMDGIDFEWFKNSTGYDFIELENGALVKLGKYGLIRYIGPEGRRSGVRLTRKGILLCDTVSSELL